MKVDISVTTLESSGNLREALREEGGCKRHVSYGGDQGMGWLIIGMGVVTYLHFMPYRIKGEVYSGDVENGSNQEETEAYGGEVSLY